MDELKDTFAANAISELDRATSATFNSAISGPLTAIGVGGSLASAELLAHLHRTIGRQPARAVTTLMALEEGALADEAALFFSAGGSNKDILAAAERILGDGAREVLAVTGDAESPLASMMKAAGFPAVIHAPAMAKDGFLATNSLVAACTRVTNAYCRAVGLRTLPATLNQLLGENIDELRASMAREVASLGDRETFMILHSGAARPAAVDIEARVNESAVGTAIPADLRSFAHGRHNWADSRTSLAAIILDDGPLTNKTARLIPISIPRVTITANSLEAAHRPLEFIVRTILLMEALAVARDVDPGKPTVPQWGRKLYTLGPPKPELPPAIFTPELEVRALVLDVDGTLLERSQRDESIGPDLAKELRRLASEGCIIAFASGRGQSLRDRVIKGVFEDCEKIILGYYNGTIIRPADQPAPLRGAPTPELAKLVGAMAELQDAIPHVVEARPTQCTFNAVRPQDYRALKEALAAAIVARSLSVQVVTSSLGIDAIAKGEGKHAVVRFVSELAGIAPEDIVTVGDHPQAGGNDFDMMKDTRAFSVAPSPIKGAFATWAGRGPQATLGLLRGFRGPNP